MPLPFKHDQNKMLYECVINQRGNDNIKDVAIQDEFSRCLNIVSRFTPVINV